MLRIYLDAVDTKTPVIHDIESEFTTVVLQDTAEVRRIISTLEKGGYVDANSFDDRFGTRLPITDLSTGCKTALLVLCETGKVIDTLECGYNALSAIITTCTEGSILMRVPYGKLPTAGYGDKIDVVIDNLHFTSFSRLNGYLQDEWPFSPDLEWEGISCLY